MKQRGFTIFELIITLAIAGILVAFGLPAIGNYLSGAKARAAANEFASAVALAKSSAIKSNRSAYVTPLVSPQPSNNEWGGGWVVWVDYNKDGVRASANVEDVLVQQSTGALIALKSGNGGQIRFNSMGLAVNFSGMELEVAGSAQASDTTRRLITVSALGATSVVKKN